MDPKPITLLFVVLALIGIITFTPSSAFADVSVTMTKGASGGQDCVTANNCFSPANTQVAPGDTVTWTNDDTASHTVTSGNPNDATTGTIFDSGLIRAGGTFEFKFANAGTYNYYCQVHPWMTGMVTVGGSVPSPTAPNLTVTTDKSFYTTGDSIIVSGSVSSVVPGTLITIQIFDTNNNYNDGNNNTYTNCYTLACQWKKR